MSFEVRPPSLPLPSRLEVHRKLGEGAFGAVFEVYDREQQCRVALKSLERLDANSLFRFKREFRELADITHPNLVRLHELFCYGDHWYFTMDLIRGVNFIDYVRPGGCVAHDAPTVDSEELTEVSQTDPFLTRGAVDEKRLRGALLQLADGVGALHQAGKLHRDLKPQNVLVCESGRVVVLDFGLLDDIGTDARDAEGQYEIVGTPAYMAPEAAAGQSDGIESDWYSVGVMLYEALTGQLPFDGKPISMLLRKQTTDPQDPEPLVPPSMSDLARLSVTLLSRNPDERPRFEGLHAALQGRTSQVVVGSYDNDPTRQSDPSLFMARQPAEFLVGRELQLELMTAAFKNVFKGQGVLLRVAGRSGMGKTALVRFFVDDLRRSKQANALLGRCFECESVPYKALDSLVDALTQRLLSIPSDEVAPLLPPDLVPLTKLFPVLRRVPLIAEAGTDVDLEGADPHEVRQAAFSSLRALLCRLAEQKPLVLWIDDLQWGDEDSAAFLANLLQPPDAPKLMLIVSHRSEDEETSPILRVLLSSLPNARYQRCEIDVGPLDPAACDQLASLLAREEDARTTQPPVGIAAESGGSPLFLMQLVRHSSRAGQANAAEQGVKVRLDDVLWEHICSLPETAQKFLRVVSLAGRSIELAVARQAAGEAEDLREAVDTLRMRRLVRTQGMRATDLVEPYHDRIREVVSARLESAATKVIHLALATALEASGRADPEALIIHYQSAGKMELAWKNAVTAGDRAANALAFRRAAELYRLALELDATRDAHAVRLKMADALANAGHGAEASQAYLDALGTADAGEAIELRRKAAEQALRVGHVDEGLSLIEDMLAAAGMKLAKTPLRAMQSLLLHRAWLRVRGFGYRGRYELDREALRRIDIGWALVVGLSNSDPIRGADIQTRTLLLALETGEQSRIARGLALEAATLATGGPKNHQRVTKLLEATTSLAEKLGDPYPLGWAHAGAAVAAYFEGRFQVCLDESQKMLELFANRPGVAWERTTARHYAIWSLIWLGRIREAAHRVREQLKAAMARGDLYSATDLRLFTSNIAWLVDDDVEGARRAVEEAMQMWSKRGFQAQHYYELYARGQLDLYVGDGEAGLARMEAAWPKLRGSMLHQIQSARIESMHLRARCALAASLQNPSGKARYLAIAESDAKHLAKENSVFAPFMAALTQAAVDRQRGNDERSIRGLRAAIEGFEGLGMMQFAAAAARRLGPMSAKAEAGAAEAAMRMTEEGIVDIERWTDLLAPGFAR